MNVAEKKLQEAIVRGAQHMIDHGLGSWKMGLHGGRRKLASCYGGEQAIKYSEHFIRVATKEQFDGVTLHEIAHALVGGYHGHDAVFKRKCVEISQNSTYARANLGEGVDIDIVKYNLICPECGATTRSNVNKGYKCSKCRREGKGRIKFNVTERELQVIAW